MRNRIFIVLLGLIATAGLQAQVNKSLGLQWGAGSIIKQDLTFSPMIYKTFSPYKVAVDYKRFGKPEQTFDVQFSAYSTSLTDQFQYYWDVPTEQETSGKHSFTFLYINYKLVLCIPPIPVSVVSTESIGVKKNPESPFVPQHYPLLFIKLTLSHQGQGK